MLTDSNIVRSKATESRKDFFALTPATDSATLNPTTDSAVVTDDWLLDSIPNRTRLPTCSPSPIVGLAIESYGSTVKCTASVTLTTSPTQPAHPSAFPSSRFCPASITRHIFLYFRGPAVEGNVRQLGSTNQEAHQAYF
jgi:hypothetical protein